MRTASTLARKRLLYPLFALGGTAAAIFFALYFVDWIAQGRPTSFFDALLQLDVGTLENALGNLAQTVAAVLGIVITVVSIVVQLAATRYTPRIANLFFRDRTNVAVIGFFVVSCLQTVWVSIAVGPAFVPRISIMLSVALVSLSLLIIGPYFAYVFDFLDPDQVVLRIQQDAVAAARASRQRDALEGVEQLSDIAVNAVSQKDKAIAQSAIDALRDLAIGYFKDKASSTSGWFHIGPELRKNPDFVSLAKDSLDDLHQKRTWLEWKVLRQYQSIYGHALGHSPDINHIVGINTRYIGEAALDAADLETARLAVKFFNTFLRATLNGGQVRTAYTVLHQYRQLAEHCLSTGHDALVQTIARHLRYYGQLAHTQHLGFVTETVAYDLSTLCEIAFAKKSSVHGDLLQTLLDLDKEAESQSQESSLRGVRKAQAKLATFYLAEGAEPEARRIFLDMKDEPPERVASIHDELARIESKDFWEVIDRGTNFDYLEPPRKSQLAKFFGWFRTA